MKHFPARKGCSALLHAALTLTLIVFFAACSRDAHEHDHDHEHDGHDHGGHKPVAKKHDHAHAHTDSDSANATVRYDEKTGLTFAPATAAAINLTTARITTRPLAHRITLNATIIDAAPPVRVTALVLPSVADDMEAHTHDGIRLLSANRALTHATGQVEVTLALAGSNVAQVSKPAVPQASKPASAPAIGDTIAIPLTGPSEQKLTIPNSAILRTATGTFAYRFLNGSYQRVPISLGVTDDTHSEILSGLADNDEVAATAVEQLWLTELRLTKGGGHSH